MSNLNELDNLVASPPSSEFEDNDIDAYKVIFLMNFDDFRNYCKNQ